MKKKNYIFRREKKKFPPKLKKGYKPYNIQFPHHQPLK